MAVQVEDKDDLPLFRKAFDILFGVVNRWVQVFVGLLPPPVEISALKAASIISVYHSIRIHEWKKLEDTVVPEVFGLRVGRNEKINDSLHHVAALRLTRVLPSQKHHALPVGSPLDGIGGDREDLTGVAAEGLAENLARNELVAVGVDEDGVEVHEQLRVGVGVGVSEEDLIVVVLKSI